jgi:hypothetical protein
LFLLGIRGTSVKAAKNLITALVKKRRPPFSVVTGFGTEKHEDAKGKYYTLTFDFVQELAPAETTAYRARWETMKSVEIKEVEPEGTGEVEDAAF